MLVTRIENRKHRVLADFRPKPPEPGLSTAAAQTLLDVMRGVIEQGTGVGIRSRFGIKGDVAGKTGTTQDYTDGWFILMHPQLVGGAWVGFNDNRVTMRNDSWGQGARNALNIVGDFFQQSLKAKAIDADARFAAPRQPQGGVFDPLLGRMNDWLGGAFQAAPPDPSLAQPAIVAEPVPARPELTIPAPAAAAGPAPATEVLSGPPSQRSPEFQWIPERPGSPEVARATPPAPEYRRFPDADRSPADVSAVAAQAGRRERAPQLVIRAPDATTRTERRPHVLEYTPVAPRERPVLRPDGGAEAAPSWNSTPPDSSHDR